MKAYLLFLGFFCLLTVGLVTVWHQVDTLRVGYDVSRLRHRVEDLHRDTNRLVVSITGRKSPPAVEEKARQYGLSLVRPLPAGASAPVQAAAQPRRSNESHSASALSHVARSRSAKTDSRVASPGPARNREPVRTIGWVTRGLTGNP
jgi:hypothetical protein